MALRIKFQDVENAYLKVRTVMVVSGRIMSGGTSLPDNKFNIAIDYTIYQDETKVVPLSRAVVQTQYDLNSSVNILTHSYLELKKRFVDAIDC